METEVSPAAAEPELVEEEVASAETVEQTETPSEEKAEEEPSEEMGEEGGSKKEE